MDDAVLTTGEELPYRVNQWIERMGNDMIWHLEPIRRISRSVQSNDTTKYDYFYKTSCGVMYNADDTRCPREGLVRQFGMRPLLWQQWALLRMEHYVRFQENHERDFMNADFEVKADALWLDWFNDPRNKDFRALVNSKPESAVKKMKDHVMQPFRLMMQIAHDKERWNMVDAHASVYQYNSLLGSGFVTSFIVLFIQITVPILILFFSVRQTSRFPWFLGSNNELNNMWLNNGPAPPAPLPWNVPETFNATIPTWDLGIIFQTNWSIFCTVDQAIDRLLMNIIIFLVYTIRVVPIVIDSFYQTVGDKQDVSSRMNSLRLIPWLQGDDNFFYQIGFKLDRYMNSAYIAGINLLMLFILFLTNSTVDVILNALAIEFVYTFDKELASSGWFDGGGRYLTAATIEILLRGELLLEPFYTNEVLCEFYDIDEAVYKEKVGGPLKDAKLAVLDEINPQFLSAEDKLNMASLAAAKMRPKPPAEAIWQFEEPVVYFGIVDTILKPKNCGVFTRYKEYFTWSRWDQALFLPRIPPIGEVSSYRGLKSLVGSGSAQGDEVLSASTTFMEKKLRFMNYDPDSHKSVVFRFWVTIVQVFMCKSLIQSVTTAYRRKNPHQIPFRFIDGIFEWISFFFIVFCFPAGLIFYLYLIFSCEPIS